MTEPLKQIAAEMARDQSPARTARRRKRFVLFVGPQGSGRTEAARRLADELGVKAYRMDVAQLVGRDAAETRRNFDRAFDEAGRDGDLLTFDEAEALFGKRSDVRDAHDRFANIEVDYLLQRLEAHRGPVVLTANRKDAIDSAFLRRMRFTVTFPG